MRTVLLPTVAILATDLSSSDSFNWLWSHRGNHRSIIGGCPYYSFIWLNSTSTWLIFLFTLFPFNPSFLIIAHLLLFLLFLLMNPCPYFKFPYQLYPCVSLFFPFLYFKLTCFVTLLSLHNCIVLASYCVVCVIWY